jgi:hypothetical protein
MPSPCILNRWTAQESRLLDDETFNGHRAAAEQGVVVVRTGRSLRSLSCSPLNAGIVSWQ